VALFLTCLYFVSLPIFCQPAYTLPGIVLCSAMALAILLLKTHALTHIHTCIYRYARTYTTTCTLRTHTCPHTPTRTQTYTHIYASKHILTYSHIFTRTRTHTHVQVVAASTPGPSAVAPTCPFCRSCILGAGLDAGVHNTKEVEQAVGEMSAGWV